MAVIWHDVWCLWRFSLTLWLSLSRCLSVVVFVEFVVIVIVLLFCGKFTITNIDWLLFCWPRLCYMVSDSPVILVSSCMWYSTIINSISGKSPLTRGYTCFVQNQMLFFMMFSSLVPYSNIIVNIFQFIDNGVPTVHFWNKWNWTILCYRWYGSRNNFGHRATSWPSGKNILFISILLHLISINTLKPFCYSVLGWWRWSNVLTILWHYYVRNVYW